METGTTVMGIIMLLLVITPFIITRRGKKKRSQKIIEKLNELATRNNATISKHLMFSKKIIGIDTTAKLLFSYAEQQEDVVDLKEISNCELSINRESLDGNKESSKIKSIVLIFSKKEKQTFRIELYNSNETFDITNEVTEGKELEAIIRETLIA